LTAGRCDIVAFLAAQGCDHTVLTQNRLKSFLARARGTRPFQAFNGIIWNEIDLGRQTPRDLGQLASLLVGVVDAGDKDILEGYSSFFRDVVITSFE
jgi:hypothetical protein